MAYATQSLASFILFPVIHSAVLNPTANCGKKAARVVPVMALAKHISPKVNSTVLFEDIATTIDGGEFATQAQGDASLTGCAKNGGSLGVVVDKTNPYYATNAFKKSGSTTEGLIIKIVKAPA